MPLTSAPSWTRVGAGSEVGQRRIALEEVVPRPADLRDLPEVVHDVDRVEPRGLRGHGDLAQPAAAAPAPPGAENSPMCSPNRNPVGPLLLASRRGGAPTNAVGTTRTGSGVRTWSKPSSRQPRLGCRPSRAAGRRGRRRGCAWPAPGCAPGTRRRACRTRPRRRACACPSRELEPPASALGVEAERVDDGGQAPADASRDDVIEQGERVGARRHVVLAGARRPRAADRWTRSCRSRSSPPPMSTSPKRPARRARRGTGAGRLRASTTRPVCPTARHQRRRAT